MITKFIKKTLILSVCGLAGIGFTKSVAREIVNMNGQRKIGQGQQKTTAAACKPAQATIDLDINNIRARLMTGGDMWWNQGIQSAAYEVPKGSSKHSLFAGSLWVGGYDPQGQLKVAAQTYRQSGNDYWPGPLSDPGNDITTEVCADWDKFWKVNAADINTFRELIAQGNTSVLTDPTYADIVEWPATGNIKAISAKGTPLTMLTSSLRSYAPFVDISGPSGTPDGIYQPDLGDYPSILGDQYIWWVYNDKGNVKGETQSASIGLEVQASAFGFSRKDALNNATFYRYKLINRGTQVLDSAFVATWSDADLGYAFDDFIGCDTTRGLGILYNGVSIDGSGQPNSYGSEVPMVAIDFFEGPKRYYKDPVTNLDTFEKLKMGGFYYYNNDFTNIGNPSALGHYYGYMTGTTRGGQRFTSGNCNAYGTGPVTKYVFYGDPDPTNVNGWSECACGNVAGDRRFVHSAGPFHLDAGASNDITIGAVWTPNVGGCPSTSFAKIKEADDLAQDLFDSGFIPTKGPDAPRLVIRELDRKFAMYLINDPSSNNFQEKFGNSDSAKYRATTNKTRKYADSLYKFEGYRIFQLKNSEVSISDIYNTDGSVNTAVAREVKQMDIKNGVNTIYNWVKDDLGNGNDTTYIKQRKVVGQDSGIVHSFLLDVDAFATGTDNKFVNYKTYYFTAVAYAYNDFGARRSSTNAVVPSFSGSFAKSGTQQDLPYLESTSGIVYTAMANPAAGNMGTYLQSDFAQGVMVRRIEGQGNGGNDISMVRSSEDSAIMAPDYRIKFPTYELSHGPAQIKVVDPVKVQPGDWELYIYGDINATAGKGITPTSGKWRLTRTYNSVTETVYSERDLSTLNEQILEKYGLSVNVKQVVRPGDDQTTGSSNGYINSSVVYGDPKVAWLAGVKDEEGVSSANWILAGKYEYKLPTGQTAIICNYSDPTPNVDSNQVYEGLFSSSQTMRGSWAPYTLTYAEVNGKCEFGVGNRAATVNQPSAMYTLASVDVVFTSDKSKWTKCIVMEMQDEVSLAKNRVPKFRPRSHASWDKDLDASGNPVYLTNGDTGKSWFPGYAINQETGERLNIVFGEDSWLGNEGGNDMLWNPTSTQIDPVTGSVINGGKHYIYVQNTRYDEGRAFWDIINSSSNFIYNNGFKNNMMWVGLPLLNTGYHYLSWKDGFIPTETRVRFRVTKPYNTYVADSTPGALKNGGLPLYTFNTNSLSAIAMGDGNPNSSDGLLSRIHAVPNPYYGQSQASGYEEGRLETFIKIINLPKKATVTIYSLDGTLVRRITKDDDTPQVLWDMKNARSLPVASGMYLIHVNAEGIGETVLKWFGGMRPIDITNY